MRFTFFDVIDIAISHLRQGREREAIRLFNSVASRGESLYRLAKANGLNESAIETELKGN